MIEAGFEWESSFLWEYYYNIYWNLTQRIFREEFDPYYINADADYNYSQRLNPQQNLRAQEVKDAVKRISLTGDIKKRLITLHGTLDALFPIKKSSDKYEELVREAKKEDVDRYHRYYKIEGGTHVDSLYDSFPDKLRPILPCYKAAFDRLVDWVERSVPPPDNGTIPKPAVGDVVNSCPELEK